MKNYNKLSASASRYFILFCILLFLTLSFSCNDGGDDIVHPVDDAPKVIVNLSQSYQEMVGFGGGLTWYSDRIVASAKKNEIMDKIVNDLDISIIRLKNWYYPVNYPNDKTTTTMEAAFFKSHFDATNELFPLIKQRNPNTKILFSSWGPPSALKSNGSTKAGTLKKVDNAFVYDEFAAYWEDVLNNITFNPDYLSIQNEPSYVNVNWETCEWRPSETVDFPGYDIGFSKVYEKIKSRPNLPILIGPESANIGNSSFGNTYSTFVNVLKDKPEVGFYAYHPYNLSESSTTSDMATSLQVVKDINNKPNMMTEYSGLSWFKTAQFINSSLKYGNSSAYIYWELIWDENSEYAMIKIAANGNYELTPYYYLMKHYSKYIHSGYKRVSVSLQNTAVDVAAFVNPANNKVVLVVLNPSAEAVVINAEVQGKIISAMTGVQSKENDTYKGLSGLSVTTPVTLPSKSITTIEMGI